MYDQLVRIADDAALFQDRITGILEAHLSNVNNRLNEVMKVLTVADDDLHAADAAVGSVGHERPLPHFPGRSAAQFWWLIGIMAAIVVGMLVMFRRKHWV